MFSGKKLKEESPLIKPVQRTKSKSHIFRLFEKNPISNDEEIFWHNGTKFSVDAWKTNRYGTRQQRTLLISEGGISNLKGKVTQWYYPIDSVHSIEQDMTNPKRIELKVIKNYSFELHDEQEVKKTVEHFQHYRLKQTVKQAISVEDFDFLKMLGKGSFSKVCLVKHKETGKLFAMKVLTKSELAKRNQVEHTNTERYILSKYKHPFIVRMYFAFQTSDKVYMVLEFVDGGELFYHLKKAKRFPEDLAKFYASEILLAIEMLHGHDIIYRDLKPENILVGTDGHLKLADFGLAKTGVTGVGGSTDKGITTKTFCGTPDYLAPEMIEGIPHGKSVDWWEFGIFLYEILTGVAPFSGPTRNELYECTLKGNIKYPDYLSDKAKDLMKKLLHPKPESRLGAHGADEVKNHPFFKGIDFEKLLKKEIEPPFKPFMNKIEINEKMDKEALKELLPEDTGGVTDKTGYTGFTFVSENILDDVKVVEEQEFKL
jgi:serine/threonine protein kinase